MPPLLKGSTRVGWTFTLTVRAAPNRTQEKMVLNARMTLASTDVGYGRRACRDLADVRVILNRSWMEIM
jgi:hypothetical protein